MNRNTIKNSSRTKHILAYLVLFIIVIVSTQLAFHTVISKDVVQGISMQPTLNDGDRLISLRHKSIKRNDIVVLDAPDQPGELYIKRVIGLPGDTVQIKNEKLYINNKLVKQPYLNNAFIKKEMAALQAKGQTKKNQPFTYDFTLKTLNSTQQETVPAGNYFVMGDNRIVSNDGRALGFIKKSAIESVVIWRYSPISKMSLY